MNPSPSNHKKLTFRLYVGLGINALIIGFEFIGGYFINSIGLMTDAGHNLIDQATQPPVKRRVGKLRWKRESSFKRTEIELEDYRPAEAGELNSLPSK